MMKTVAGRRALTLAIAATMVPMVVSAHHDSGTPVGPVTAALTAVNYGGRGAVDALVIGTTLLTFSRFPCDGVGALGKAGDNVTYSGMQETLKSGAMEVQVTTFLNNTTSDTYPPAPDPKPSAYALTAGMIAALNVNLETGMTDGFLFKPTMGTSVFVDIGEEASTSLTALLIVGNPISVTGTLVPPATCAPVGAIAEVFASSLTIGTTVYPIGNEDHEGGGGDGGGDVHH